MAFEHVLDHRHNRLGREARGVDFACALDPAGGLELEEQEVAAAEGGRRIADYEGFQFGDFHACFEARVGGDRILLSWPAMTEQRLSSVKVASLQNRITLRTAAPEREEARASLIDSSR